VQLERALGYSLYFGLNFIPTLASAGLALGLLFRVPLLNRISVVLLLYVFTLFVCYKILARLQSWHTGQWAQYGGDPANARSNQYSIGERNTQIYHNVRFVWPGALHPVGNEHKPSPPTVFCLVPHGILPVGALAYPFFSKLFSPRLCRWTAAPVLFSIPIIKGLFRAIGSIPATGRDIAETLADGTSDVGIILDGIAGTPCLCHRVFGKWWARRGRRRRRGRRTVLSLARGSGIAIACSGPARHALRL